MMRLSILFLCLLISSPSRALVNALPMPREYGDVVRVRLSNGWVCSGVFLDPFTILTAAHCISPGPKPQELKVERIESTDNIDIPIEVHQMIPHPKYSEQVWHAYDVGIIKTTKYQRYKGGLVLADNEIETWGEAILLGCGKQNLKDHEYHRLMGQNSYIRLGPILTFFGESGRASTTEGWNVSIAPNDSGGPILDQHSGKIIGVMSTTTLKLSGEWGLPVLSTGTSALAPDNLNFIQGLLGDTIQ